MLVEEVSRHNNANSTTVYFSSSINLTARPSAFRLHNSLDAADPNASKKARTKVNYNLTLLMNAQTEANKIEESAGPLKSAQQIQLERLTSKRLAEISRDSPHNSSFELPKNFQYNSIHSCNDISKPTSRLGNTPTTKRILSARRNLNLYFEEERNLISINTILALNYHFLDNTDMAHGDEKSLLKRSRPFKPRLKLCCVCGLLSSYLRCYSCGLFACSVRCNALHIELRCV